MAFPFAGKTWGQTQAKPKAAQGAATGKVSLDFKDIELPDLIQTISELTGKNFVYDETVRGKVTIISPSSMTLDEAYQVFLTVLSVKGYTVVPSGDVNKIILNRQAKESNLPTMVEGGKKKAGEQYVTRIIPLQNVDASVLASSVLTPLVPKTSNIVAYAPTNTLIITDNAANIDRLAQIIHELDVQTSQQVLEVIPLKYANADDVAKVATEILSQVATIPRRGRARINVQTAGSEQASKVLAYPRTNSLVIMANSDDLATIKNLISELDQKASLERSNINVYYLENADAETLAKTLNEIVTGIKTQAKTPQTARRPQATKAAALSNESVSITADKPTNSLIINSTPEDYEIIKGIIRQLDIKRKQVFVEALILELSMDETENLGAALQGAVATGNNSLVFGTSNLNTGPAALSDLASTSGTGTPDLLAKTIDGILLGGLFSPITVTAPDGTTTSVPAFSALIDLSKRNADINILSAPSLLTSDNEEAEILVGSNVPIITSRLTNAVGTATAATPGLATSVAVDRKDVALTLKITPQITEGSRVRLKVDQEITDLAPTSVGDVNQVGPTFTKRLLKNTVLAEDGKTIVLGGLISNNVTKTVSKVPILGDIPILGYLFRHDTTVDKKTNLLIFITPKIIKNADDLDEVTERSREALENARKGVLPTVESQVPRTKNLAPPAAAPADTPVGH
jgi:general secretion pathway protein D